MVRTTAAGSITSPRTTSTSSATPRVASRVPSVERSKATTLWPCSTRSAATYAPMKPVPPVTSTVAILAVRLLAGKSCRYFLQTEVSSTFGLWAPPFPKTWGKNCRTRRSLCSLASGIHGSENRERSQTRQSTVLTAKPRFARLGAVYPRTTMREPLLLFKYEWATSPAHALTSRRGAASGRVADRSAGRVATCSQL